MNVKVLRTDMDVERELKAGFRISRAATCSSCGWDHGSSRSCLGWSTEMTLICKEKVIHPNSPEGIWRNTSPPSAATEGPGLRLKLMFIAFHADNTFFLLLYTISAQHIGLTHILFSVIFKVIQDLKILKLLQNYS